MSKYLEWMIARHGSHELLPVYLENNVCNIYMQREVSPMDDEALRRSSPVDTQSGNDQGRAPERP